MSDTYKDALAHLAELALTHCRGQSYHDANGTYGALVGFALHSETLDRLAILEKADLTLEVRSPDMLSPAGGFHASAFYFPGRRKLEAMRHTNGNIYTQIATIPVSGEAHTLYAAHSDLTWWLRPSKMFHDGRFTPAPDHRPLQPQQIVGR